MRAAIRKHMRDFIAVAGLCAIALVTVYVILQQQRLRIPILEQKPFTLKADFATAQAVTPGQGQTVVVAGVKIGDISKVELQDGKASRAARKTSASCSAGWGRSTRSWHSSTPGCRSVGRTLRT